MSLNKTVQLLSLVTIWLVEICRLYEINDLFLGNKLEKVHTNYKDFN